MDHGRAPVGGKLPAVDFEDSVAADDWVQCWAIELGFPQLAGRTANGVWVMSQQAYLRPTGGGTAGRLLNDPGLYDDLRGLVTRLDSLSADLQKNPKKYINLRIF